MDPITWTFVLCAAAAYLAQRIWTDGQAKLAGRPLPSLEARRQRQDIAQQRALTTGSPGVVDAAIDRLANRIANPPPRRFGAELRGYLDDVLADTVVNFRAAHHQRQTEKAEERGEPPPPPPEPWLELDVLDAEVVDPPKCSSCRTAEVHTAGEQCATCRWGSPAPRRPQYPRPYACEKCGQPAEGLRCAACLLTPAPDATEDEDAAPTGPIPVVPPAPRPTPAQDVASAAPTPPYGIPRAAPAPDPVPATPPTALEVADALVDWARRGTSDTELDVAPDEPTPPYGFPQVPADEPDPEFWCAQCGAEEVDDTGDLCPSCAADAEALDDDTPAPPEPTPGPADTEENADMTGTREGVAGPAVAGYDADDTYKGLLAAARMNGPVSAEDKRQLRELADEAAQHHPGTAQGRTTTSEGTSTMSTTVINGDVHDPWGAHAHATGCATWVEDLGQQAEVCANNLAAKGVGAAAVGEIRGMQDDAAEFLAAAQSAAGVFTGHQASANAIGEHADLEHTVDETYLDRSRGA